MILAFVCINEKEMTVEFVRRSHLLRRDTDAEVSEECECSLWITLRTYHLTRALRYDACFANKHSLRVICMQITLT